MSGITLARPLQLDDKPVTRVENFCATGSEALRQAAYAVASGAYDIAMAVGVEKVKDSGLPGPQRGPAAERRHRAHAHRGGDVLAWSRPAYAAKYGVDADKMREALAHVAWKNHYNGARNSAGAVPARGVDGDDLQLAASWRASSACSTARVSPTAPPPRSSCGPRTRTSTPTSRSS